MLSREEGIKVVTRGLILLGILTIVEVLIALYANGHIWAGHGIVRWIYAPLMIAFSLYKAYFIVYEFMHMRYEVGGMAKSVLLPTLLLVWAVIAFMQEGGAWKRNRQVIKDRNMEQVQPVKTGYNNSKIKQMI
ncbi:MAG: hypothetical protein RLZZ292_2848 [Bacteroidota bacterium]|jgi:cytochrome c oxidase subunit IV